MIAHLSELAGTWWGWIAPAAAQLTALIVLVGTADLLLRKRVWPDVLYAAWVLVIVSMFVPPSLSSLVSLPVLPSAPGAPWGWAAAAAVQLFGMVVLVAIADRLLRGRLVPDVFAAALTVVAVRAVTPMPASPPVTLPVLVADGELSVLATGTAAAVGGPSVWPVVAAIAWVAGAAAMLGWVGVTYVSYRRSQREPDGAAHDALRETLTEVAREMGLRRTPRLAVSSRVPSAGVFGILRPVVVLPEDMQPGPEARHILLHECAHIRRHDHILHGMSLLAVVLFWFNPLVWLAHRRLARLREVCCDALVADILRGETRGYRSALLAEAERTLLMRPEHSPVVGLLGVVEEESMLITRIQWLDRNLWKVRRARSLAALAVVAVMSATALPMCSGSASARNAIISGGAVRIAEATATPVDTVHPWEADGFEWPIARITPEYPDTVRALGLGARFLVTMIVDPTGEVSRAKAMLVSSLASPTHVKAINALADAAEDAALRTRFAPPMVNGRPVALRVRQVVTF